MFSLDNYVENKECLTFVRDVANTYKTRDQYIGTILKRFPDFVNRFIVRCPYGGCVKRSFVSC